MIWSITCSTGARSSVKTERPRESAKGQRSAAGTAGTAGEPVAPEAGSAGLAGPAGGTYSHTLTAATSATWRSTGWRMVARLARNWATSLGPVVPTTMLLMAVGMLITKTWG